MKNSLLLLVFAAFLASCSNSKKTPSGFEFTVLRKGDGVKVDSGKFIVMNFLFKDGKDSKTHTPIVPVAGSTPFSGECWLAQFR